MAGAQEAIRTFDPDSAEYARLRAAAEAVSRASGLEAKVEDTWFDYGQRWKWTTVLARRDGTWIQALAPAMQARILDGPEEDAMRHAEAAGKGLIIPRVRNGKAPAAKPDAGPDHAFALSCAKAHDTADSFGRYVSTYCGLRHEHLLGFGRTSIPCRSCPDYEPRKGRNPDA